MEQKTERLYPPAPLEKKINDLEQWLEKKDVNRFIFSINNIKEINTYFSGKNHKAKTKYKKHKTLTSILKSFDTVDVIATTSSSIRLFLTRIGLTVLQISTCIACGFKLSNKVI